jgi:hypothetical protein
MPARGPICALRASARRTSDSGCSGWPTPKAKEDGRTLEDYEKGRQKGYKARKGKTSGGPASRQGGLAIAAQLAGWPTPQHRDGNQGGQVKRADGTRMNLDDYALLAGWQTPKGNEKVRSDHFLKGREPNAEEALAFGPGPICSRAGTAKFGALSPEHSRWLMGFPAAWGCCAATAMRSCRK